MGCKKVLFLSPEEMQLAKKIYGVQGNNFELVGDGVKQHGLFYPDRFRAKYEIEGPYILSVGRKDRGKNIHLLVEYFDHYKGAEHDDLKLVFIGGGDDSLLPKRDYFIDLGFIDEDDKHDAYAGALATCNLSVNESFSLVIMESWQAARPVIVNGACPVTKGHCIRCNGGLYVSDGDEFCETLRFLTGNPGLANKMGANGRRYVLDNFSWDRITQKYVQALKEFEDS
jgi:glycosyltransferase involved in cell wall biosynthesis